MSGFSAEWLSLREPADHRARHAGLLASAAALLHNKPQPLLVDLACGTGSTFRAMAEHLPEGQRWRLCDYDPALLEAARATMPGAPLTTVQVDLKTDLATALADGPDLVVTSAFLDLVSEEWLAQLVGALAERQLPFYAALNYDGRASCDPPHRTDKAVIEAVNRHQRIDKGFGPALGPQAAERASALLAAAGFAVTQAQSDWLFLPTEGLVQSMVIDGWAGAAREIGGVLPDELEDWRDWHLTRIASGHTQIMVGHVDLLAIPG